MRMKVLVGGLNRAAFRCAMTLAMAGGSSSLWAQTAILSGTMSSFDVVNRTGQPAHGFEIQLDGALPTDLYYTVYGGRYGNPQVVPYSTGVRVRYSATYTNGQWSATTPVANYNNFSWQNCYLGGAGYNNSGCEHLGQSMKSTTNTITVTAYWLVEDPANPGNLIGSDPASVPMVGWIVPPPTATQPSPPVVSAVVPAPVPPPPPAQFSDAVWVKIYKRELPRQVDGSELTSDNTNVVPEDPTLIETNWDILQKAPPGVQQRKGKSTRTNSGNLAITSQSVLRRYEIYKHTGAYDPLTHEVACADGTCTAPSAGELGEPLSANNPAANVVADSWLLNMTGSGASSATVTVGTSTCSNSTCGNYATNGATISLTANPSSTVFGGWDGVCSGTQLTCSITISGKTVVSANFKKVFTLSVGRSNPGAVTATPNGVDRALNCGGTCSAKFADGTAVTLTATPPDGKTFVNWSGACSGTLPTCTVTIAQDTSVQAVFSK